MLLFCLQVEIKALKLANTHLKAQNNLKVGNKRHRTKGGMREFKVLQESEENHEFKENAYTANIL